MAGIEPMQVTSGLPVAARVTRRLPRGKATTSLGSVVTLGYAAINALRRDERLVDADVLGFRMQLDPREFVDCALLLMPHLYDYPEIGFLTAHLRPGDTFLDIGAHIGFYALLASRAVGPDGAVLAVEADPRTYARLCAMLRANGIGNVHALNVGVSDKAETLRLGAVPYPFKAASGFLSKKPGAFDVPCRPLLDIVRERGVTAIRGAKLDIEGFEFRVLSRFLHEAPGDLLPEFIITEHHPVMVRRAGGDTLALLHRHGYRIHQKSTINYIMVRD